MGVPRLHPPRDVTRGWLLVAAVWAVATAVGLGFAAVTTVGPVALQLSQNHGVHLGDLIAFAAAYGTAMLATVIILEPVYRAPGTGRG